MRDFVFQLLEAMQPPVIAGDLTTEAQQIWVESHTINRVLDILEALHHYRTAEDRYRTALAAAHDDEYVGLVWAATQDKLEAEARLWEMYDA